MVTTELFVGLKVPDNTAITAFHTLERIGYNKLKKVERQDYYKFEFSGDVKGFQSKISAVDILVNANKHQYSFNLERNNNENARKSEIHGSKASSTTSVVFGINSVEIKKINVLVQNLDDAKSLLSVLRTRLGFKNIKNVEKGVLWSLSIDADKKEAENIAIEITKNLLMNENYQKFKVV